MSALSSSAVTASRRPRPAAEGFTLLEVLVSMGLIIGALAAIAALLPATGSRLAEATDIDRSATMVANARADLLNRGLVKYELWQTGSVITGNTRAIVFGEGLTIGGTALAPALTMTTASNVIALAGPAAVSRQIDPTTGFQLRDVVTTTVTATSVVTGTKYEPSICYGCMLSSSVAPGQGAPMRMTTVVFRKPSPTVQGLALTGTFGLPLTVIGTLTTSGAVVPVDGLTAAALRKQYLPGCAWVLVSGTPILVSGTPMSTLEPRWVQIGSSWTNFQAGDTVQPTGTSSVMLTGTDHKFLFPGTTKLPTGELVGSGTLRVFGFDGLLRIDERSVNLE